MIKPNFIIALFLLLAVFTLGYFLISSDRPLILPPVGPGALIFKDAKLNNVTEIEIKKDGVTVRLEKKDKRWLLVSHKNRPAKAERVETLLLDACSARVEGTRDGKPALFALDEKGVTELVLINEGIKHPLYLGKSLDFSKSFVRADKEGNIYEVDRAIDISAGIRTEKEARLLDPTYFFDLNLLSLPVDEILDIQIEKGKDSARIRRAISGKEPLEPKQNIPKNAKLEWQLVEPEKALADDGAVTRITSQFIALNFKKYAEGLSDKEMGLDAPIAKVTLKMKDGSSHVLSFGKIVGDEIYAGLEGRDDRYVIFKFTYDTIALPFEDLKKKENEKKDEKEMKALTPKADPKLPAAELERIKKEVEAQYSKPKPQPKPQKETPPAPPPAEALKAPEAPPAVIK